MAKNQKRPEDFLELVERAKRGRLKVYHRRGRRRRQDLSDA